MTSPEPGTTPDPTSDQEQGSSERGPGQSSPDPDPSRSSAGPDPAPEPGPAERLAELLETAAPDVRREITAWLLRMRQPPQVGMPWLPPAVQLQSHAGSRHDPHERLASLLHSMTGNLPATVDSQVVTIRLPSTRHAALRDWCAEHGFSMAAVVRGLVERFLEEQTA
jgi:hypothetical protein